MPTPRPAQGRPEQVGAQHAAPLGATFQLEIITPDRTVFSGEVTSLVAPAAEGSLGVLAHHAPLITSLGVGEARATGAGAGGPGADVFFAVTGGFLQVCDNRAILLADAAERAEQIDVARAEQAQRRAEQERSTLAHADPQLVAAEAALRRALNRLRVAREHGRAD